MDIQSTIASGLTDILTVLIGVLVTYAVAFIKQHFSARQIATASWIATDSVNFAAQAAKKLGITADNAKYNSALTKAKELASKAGLHFTDSQWETLLESAYKKAKAELQPLQDIASTAPAMTQDDIVNMIKAELDKVFTDKQAQPQNEGNAPAAVDSGVVTPAPVEAVSIAPKTIVDVVGDALDKVGETAKALAVNDLTQKIADVVQGAVAPEGTPVVQ